MLKYTSFAVFSVLVLSSSSVISISIQRFVSQQTITAIVLKPLIIQESFTIKSIKMCLYSRLANYNRLKSL
jgi:hypothetical protein